MPSEQNLTPIIKKLGSDLVGCEVGVLRATNIVALINNCPNIKILYGIDFYQPYSDLVFNYKVNEGVAEYNKSVAIKKISECSNPEKIKLIIQDVESAINNFEDNFFDFVYLDRNTSDLVCYYDVFNWYKKVKVGGILSGHDFYSATVQKFVIQALKDVGYRGKLDIINNESWVIVKNNS
jgi:hypothetical protein